MAGRRGRLYPQGMTNTTRSALIATAILLPFTAFSLWVVAGQGITGVIALARNEPWGMQLLLDLVIACGFGIGWMRADAKRRGIASWPFIVLVLAAGSIGLLGYVAVRGFMERGAMRAPRASAMGSPLESA